MNDNIFKALGKKISMFHFFLIFLLIRTAIYGTVTRTMNSQGVTDRAGEEAAGARDATHRNLRYFFCSPIYIVTLHYYQLTITNDYSQIDCT